MNTKKTSLLILIFLCGFFAVAQSSGSKSAATGSKTTTTTGSKSAASGSKSTTTGSTVKKSNPLDKVRIGGDLNFGLSNDYYFLTAAPRVSMEVTKWFVPGISVAYMYAQETGSYSATTYGAGVFTDIYPIQYVFGRVEYQRLWYTQKVTGIPEKYTFNDNFLLMGVGARVPVGNRMSMSASVLFNVLNNEKSDYYMYKNPIYGVGVEVGL